MRFILLDSERIVKMPKAVAVRRIIRPSQFVKRMLKIINIVIIIMFSFE